MKKLLILLFSLFSIHSSGQTVDLKWKIGEKETLNYLTVMNDIDTSDIELNFGDFFKAFSDSTGKGLSKSKDFFKELNKAMQEVDFVSTLTNNGKGVIDVIMSSSPKENPSDRPNKAKDSKENEVLSLMKSMNLGVMLRGSVYASGGLHSFWVKSSQKNVISLFFELPSKPVKIGDTWKLDVNLIGNDQNFDCDSSFKMNEVTLTDFKKNKDETVAVVKYNIVEYVIGTFNSPAFMGGGGEQTTMMKFTYQAIAEFSETRGRWISYDGIMSLEATGFMKANKKTKFTLISQ